MVAVGGSLWAPVTPEVDPSSAASTLVLLGGTLLVLRSRSRS
jgi:hypothetical protein